MRIRLNGGTGWKISAAAVAMLGFALWSDWGGSGNATASLGGIDLPIDASKVVTDAADAVGPAVSESAERLTNGEGLPDLSVPPAISEPILPSAPVPAIDQNTEPIIQRIPDKVVIPSVKVETPVVIMETPPVRLRTKPVRDTVREIAEKAVPAPSAQPQPSVAPSDAEAVSPVRGPAVPSADAGDAKPVVRSEESPAEPRSARESAPPAPATSSASQPKLTASVMPAPEDVGGETVPTANRPPLTVRETRSEQKSLPRVPVEQRRENFPTGAFLAVTGFAGAGTGASGASAGSGFAGSPAGPWLAVAELHVERNSEIPTERLLESYLLGFDQWNQPPPSPPPMERFFSPL